MLAGAVIPVFCMEEVRFFVFYKARPVMNCSVYSVLKLLSVDSFIHATHISVIYC